MVRIGSKRSLTTAWVGIVAAAGHAQPVEKDRLVARQENPPDAQTVSDAEVAALVGRLESPDYTERQAADTLLKAVGLRAVDALAPAFQQTDDFEARIRIQRIVEEIFFWDRVYGKNAFLGISHSAYDPTAGRDPRVPQGKAAFRVEAVIEGTAAARAGLLAQDIIIAIDGEMLNEGATAPEFAERIRVKRPGAVVALDVYRADTPMHMEVRLGARPREAYNQGQAGPELLQQRDAAMTEFPAWWTARFGQAPFDTKREHRPRYLELPVDGGEP
ncbi:MAG: PDZ domain-containing protein [Phycisphaerales bacterium]|nr:PDZ domain-containing protein [Phycisphaerales bacterium]